MCQRHCNGVCVSLNDGRALSDHELGAIGHQRGQRLGDWRPHAHCLWLRDRLGVPQRNRDGRGVTNIVVIRHCLWLAHRLWLCPAVCIEVGNAVVNAQRLQFGDAAAIRFCHRDFVALVFGVCHQLGQPLKLSHSNSVCLSLSTSHFVCVRNWHLDACAHRLSLSVCVWPRLWHRQRLGNALRYQHRP